MEGERKGRRRERRGGEKRRGGKRGGERRGGKGGQEGLTSESAPTALTAVVLSLSESTPVLAVNFGALGLSSESHLS